MGATIGAVGLSAATLSSASATSYGSKYSSKHSKVIKVSTEKQLRAAVAKANSTRGADRIELQRSISLTISGTDSDGPSAGDLDVKGTLVVDGNGRSIDARGTDRIFDVPQGSSLTLSRIDLRGGSVTDSSGGAIRSSGKLTVSRSKISHSTAQGTGASGGAIANLGGTLVVSRSTLARNSASRAGGAIEANAGSTRITSSALRDNVTGSAPGNGGAVHLTGAGKVWVRYSSVTGNTASAEGGGLWNSATGTFVVERSRVSGNSAAGNDADQGGGGLFNDGGSMSVTRSTISANKATGTSGSGGGILNNLGSLQVERSTMKGNSSSRAGGAIETNAGTVVLRDVDLRDNRTGANPGNGGGLHTSGAGQVTFDRGSVTGNSAAKEGGGLWNSPQGTMTVTHVKIKGNSAPVGANVFNQPPGGTFTIDGAPVPAGPNTI